MRFMAMTKKLIERANESQSKKILFVAMHHSVHTARWISQLFETGWDLFLFAVDDNEPHNSLKSITLYEIKYGPDWENSEGVKRKNIYPFKNGKLLDKLMGKVFPLTKNRAYWLARVIQEIQPDIIHSMEMQHAGYLTYEAKSFYKGKFPRWIYSCWGSDIYFFQQFEDHKKRITEVLTNCNFLFTDCYRDINLARKFGFAGKVLGTYPGVGGFKINEMLSLVPYSRPSDRRIVVVKGYYGWVYRPLIVLKALEACGKELKGYTVVLYLAHTEMVKEAERLQKKLGVEFRIFPYSSHDEVIKLFASARISISSSISDGTPNSMLESMVMGAFPIQSDTISTGEWIESGLNGYLVQPEDIDGFTFTIKQALTDDALINSAAELNLKMLKERIDISVIQPKVVDNYRQALTEVL